MSELTPSLEAEIQTLREAYAALNRGDIPGFVNMLDPQIERIEPEGFPTAGTYRGLAAVTAHVSKGRGTWAEGSCEPERFIVAPATAPITPITAHPGDTIVVFVHVRVRLKDRVDWIEARFADGYIFRNGKAVQFRTFGGRREALEWAGVGAEI